MKAETWALGLSLGLVTHAVLIARAPGRNWLQRARRYRTHQWCGAAVAILPLLVFAGACQYSLGWSVTGGAQLLTASLVIFMLGMLRSCLDLVTGGKPSEKSSAWDAFLLALVVAIVLDLLSDWLHVEEGMASVMATPTTHVVGLLGVIVSSLVYLISVWGLLARQLGQVDGFSRPAVLAFLRSLLPEIPLQVVLIGPKQSGKTRIACSLTKKEEYKKRKDSGQPWSAICHGSIDLSLTKKNGAAKAFKQRLMLSVVDTPGERMGQHLAAAILNRTDALVLAVNLRAIPQNHHSVASVLNGLKDATEPLEVSARDYFSALRFATDGAMHDSAPHILESLRLTYKARSFCLVIYGEGQPRDQQPSRLNVESAKQLAAELGKMFGIDDQSCIGFAYLAVDANYSVNSQEFIEVVARTALEGACV